MEPVLMNNNAPPARRRPITADPIQLRRPRALDDVDLDELDGFTIIELGDKYDELDPDADIFGEPHDDPDLDDPAFRAFLDDLEAA
jgi:hypothetical protein